jgi:hypothetical protein
VLESNGALRRRRDILRFLAASPVLATGLCQHRFFADWSDSRISANGDAAIAGPPKSSRVLSHAFVLSFSCNSDRVAVIYRSSLDSIIPGGASFLPKQLRQVVPPIRLGRAEWVNDVGWIVSRVRQNKGRLFGTGVARPRHVGSSLRVFHQSRSARRTRAAQPGANPSGLRCGLVVVSSEFASSDKGLSFHDYYLLSLRILNGHRSIRRERFRASGCQGRPPLSETSASFKSHGCRSVHQRSIAGFILNAQRSPCRVP